MGKEEEEMFREEEEESETGGGETGLGEGERGGIGGETAGG
jgi:hypothetical protein